MPLLSQMLAATPYAAYTYAYPHKTAYRPLERSVHLRELWAAERRDALFLYLHIPFCEMRCGFCNLFTTVNPGRDIETLYLDTLQRQAQHVSQALGPAAFARLAIGGGTPTYLQPAGLHRLFDIAEHTFGVDPQHIPVSVETSPKTSDEARLRTLLERGTDRISIGVQSFVEAEVQGAGRAQKTAEVLEALERIRSVGFPTLNLDLIYGMPGQTVESWLYSLHRALEYRPEELFLYPLYVRPLTGLGRQDKQWDDIRLACYRVARDLLLDAGYTQVSMRMFRAAHAPNHEGPAYCCQEDGMVGLGCGARSYTSALDYSSEYAVGAQGVRAILHDYVNRPVTSFDYAEYGVSLDAEDQRRRYLIQSLLQVEGLDFTSYQARFGTDVLADFPQLWELMEHGLAQCSPARLQLTAHGIERSDMIGPWLYAQHMRDLMKAYELR